MGDTAASPDTSNGVTEDGFAIGAVIHDREDDDPNDAIVVNTPSKRAQDWHAHNGKSVAEDNPEYSADAPVIVVVFADALRAAFPDWEEDAPLALTAINESDASHYSFPAPRLRRIDSSPGDGEREKTDAAGSDESPPTASNEQEPAAAPDTADDGGAPASDEPPVTAADLSASMRALKERLEDGGMTVESEPDGQALQATKLGDTYRVRPGEIIEGDGALRAQLAPIVLDNPRYKPVYGTVPAGLGNRGLQIFCPISPNRVLLLYDPQVYRFDHNSKKQVLIKSTDVVDELNLLQFHNAENIVMFDSSTENYIQDLHDQIGEARRREEITMPLETESMEREEIDKVSAYQAPKLSPGLPNCTTMAPLPYKKRRPSCQAQKCQNLVHRIFNEAVAPDVAIIYAIRVFEERLGL